MGLALAVVAAAGVGCGEKVSASVDCVVQSGSTIACTVQQTKGKAALEVCWDFQVSCASGATLEAERTCAVVSDGGSTDVTIPADKVTIKGACEGEKTAKLSNLSWKAK